MRQLQRLFSFISLGTVLIHISSLQVKCSDATASTADWTCSQPYNRPLNLGTMGADPCTNAIMQLVVETFASLPELRLSVNSLGRPDLLPGGMMVVYHHIPWTTVAVSHPSDPGLGPVITLKRKHPLRENADFVANLEHFVQSKMTKGVADGVDLSRSLFRYDFKIRKALVCVGFRIETPTMFRSEQSRQPISTISWMTSAVPVYVGTTTAYFYRSASPATSFVKEHSNRIEYLGPAGPPIKPSEFTKSPYIKDLSFHYHLDVDLQHTYCNADWIFQQYYILEVCVTNSNPMIFTQARVQLMIQCGNHYPTGTTVYLLRLYPWHETGRSKSYISTYESYSCNKGEWLRYGHSNRDGQEEWARCMRTWRSLASSRTSSMHIRVAGSPLRRRTGWPITLH